MTEKKADLNKTLYELTTEYPELIDILFGLGFAGVKNPQMRETHGKLMTVKTGCGHLGLDLGQVSEILRSKGFTVTE
ncbi:MAG: hypothetical protein COX65_03955 [Elusimicrobia bacterium CG_4_10_14_0_2_um_filter_56_8]|nr:MAG: hypothetical protein AUJ51_01555 [Elusimicrobia bacterium CG1_02_56_21]PJA15552.1 MAG: hypothetical protein COX65_03955 [Elusimicrobia bacterium CG_4_10_14_0_2_um_filter_56_8]